MADGEQPRDLRPTEGADATSRLLEELLAEGKPVAEIAVRLGISVPDAHARIRGVPPEFVSDKVYDNEQDPQHDIFLMRLDEFPETDGFPEHFHQGWKRRDDNWAAS